MENLVSFEYLRSSFAGKKVFITGHTGFKGSWMLAYFRSLGAILKGYALDPAYPDSLFSLLEPVNFFEHVIADVKDKQRLAHEIEIFQPDFIFHLAAQPLVRRSYEVPAETFEVNVVGTANLLEAVRDIPGKCTVVIITTDKVYENREIDVLYQEEDALGGYDPYSASKACAELVVSSFRNSFFNTSEYSKHKKSIATARAGNVIGGGDWSENRIIPDIVRALHNQKGVEVRNPEAIRPWQHVLEPITGYVQLAINLENEPKEFSRAFNFGPRPTDHLSVRELVETAISVLGQGSWKVVSSKSNPHEAGMLKLDINRALKQLKWRPKLDAKTAITWTMSWYNQPRELQYDYTLKQIQEYILK